MLASRCKVIVVMMVHDNLKIFSFLNGYRFGKCMVNLDKSGRVFGSGTVILYSNIRFHV